MYPDRDTLSNVPLPRSGYISSRDQRMVGSSVPEAVKTLPVFFFVNEHKNTHTKPHLKSNGF